MADRGRPRLLLVNDDGAGAIGLQKLKAAADTVSGDVWIVAPATERSGASHAISLTQPIRARVLGTREFAVDGSPVDCVALALSALLDRPPDLVLSGVNRGPNLAGDILYSGTCGAAREAALRGIPAAALSVAAVPGKSDEWGGVDGHLAPLLAQLANARVTAFLIHQLPVPARSGHRRHAGDPRGFVPGGPVHRQSGAGPARPALLVAGTSSPPWPGPARHRHHRGARRLHLHHAAARGHDRRGVAHRSRRRSGGEARRVARRPRGLMWCGSARG